MVPTPVRLWVRQQVRGTWGITWPERPSSPLLLSRPSCGPGRRPVPVLRKNDSRHVLPGCARVVRIRPEDEHDHIGVLPQAPGLAKVREHRSLVRPLLDGPRELRRQHRNPQLSRRGSRAPRDVRHLRTPVLHAPVTGHQLQVVHDHRIKPYLPMQPTALGSQLQRDNCRCAVEVRVIRARGVHCMGEAIPPFVEDLPGPAPVSFDRRRQGDQALPQLFVDSSNESTATCLLWRWEALWATDRQKAGFPWPGRRFARLMELTEIHVRPDRAPTQPDRRRSCLPWD